MYTYLESDAFLVRIAQMQGLGDFAVEGAWGSQSEQEEYIYKADPRLKSSSGGSIWTDMARAVRGSERAGKEVGQRE